MRKTEILDLNFRNEKDLITAYLVRSDETAVLVECGPDSCFETLKTELKKSGLEPSDLDFVLPTHIHLDHAGAAWRFAQEGVRLAFHPKGVRHMVNPSRLYDSAQRIYGDQMEALWGKLEAIPEDLITVPEDREILKIGSLEFKAIFTPGHAKHHISWQIEKDLFSGDSCGGKILNGPAEIQTPPPDINFELWMESLDKLLNIDLEALYLTHSGKVSEAHAHIKEIKRLIRDAKILIDNNIDEKGEIDLKKLEESVKMKRLKEMEKSKAHDNPDLIRKYGLINPDFMSAQGLKLYREKLQN